MIQKENIVEKKQLLKFKHLRFSLENEEHIVSLIDAQGYEILRGYGNSIIEAMNDLHHNLI
jgi:hypothetical protein